MEIKGFFSAFKKEINHQKQALVAQVKEMAIEANKRIDDLKKSGVTSQALMHWENAGAIKFGINNGSYQDYQSEFWRIKNFLDAKTSTVNGAKSVISTMIAVTNMPFGVEDITKKQAEQYFKLADKLADYYKMTGQTAKALDYQQIWNQINVMIENDIVNLNEVSDSVNDITKMLLAVDYLNDEISASTQYDSGFAGLQTASSKKGKFKLPSILGVVTSKILGAIKPLFRFGHKK